MTRHKTQSPNLITIPLAVVLSTALPTAAQAAPAVRSAAPETVTVVGTSPLPGTAIDPDKLPTQTQTLLWQDLEREGVASTITGLSDRFSSVNINDNLDDPFQPDILFHGFEASPALGTPEGLAVYQNGIRINEGFGDTLNWDLIPDGAVYRIDVVSSNPVYGLNALGGAVLVTMKDGFTFQGAQADLSGGSWGQRQGNIQFGANDGTFGLYVSARGLQEDGWRQFSPDTLEQLYADLSFRSGKLKLDLSYTGGNNSLSGESPAPVQELAVGRSLIFTSPQKNIDRLHFFALNGSYDAGGGLSLQGTAYYRIFHQGVVNGNTTDYTPCAAGTGLCQSDATTVIVDRDGTAIPDISQGGAVAIGENDFENIRTEAVGATAQINDASGLFGHRNQFTLGGSIDRDATIFGSSAEPGTINPRLVVQPSGYFVNTPEGTPFTATPVDLHAANTYLGVYLTDTFDVTEAFSLTASGRYNLAKIDLEDQLGAALSGRNKFDRFDPAFGASYRVTPSLTVFGGYSEGNRAPTPAEIECSNPTAPCLLPSSLSSDPPNLRQVVSHAYEAGLRGHFDVPGALGGRLGWSANLFRTDVDDDIYAVAASLNAGYFQNISGTRRQGADLGLNYRAERLRVSLAYSYIEATFQSDFLLPSPFNSAADANGSILVTKGDRLPGIPANRIKLAVDYTLLPRWVVGGALVYQGSQYFRGDEANQMAPLASYAFLNLHTSYDVTESVTWWVDLVNVTNAKYSTFGVLGDPTGVGAPGVDDNKPDFRFESPSAPFSVFSGIRLRL